MEIGLIGMPQSGKTTIFNALTGASASTVPGGRMEANVAMVNVPDERVDRLTALFQPKKVVHATVRYVDIPGQAVEAAGRKGLSDSALSHLASTEMQLATLRGFPRRGGVARGRGRRGRSA
jgi:ribosome-binding ATPase YchF (GTP1/OBG family)